MADYLLRRDARILVCDGRTALFLRNAGNATEPSFEVEETMRGDPARRTADIGSDAPGRIRQMLSGPASAIEGTDLHQEQENAFVRKALAAFHALVSKHGVDQVVIVAPPKALATIRANLNHGLRAKIVAEFDKDLTRHPVADIQRIVLG
jgi:protein required for attachment to host cells